MEDALQMSIWPLTDWTAGTSIVPSIRTDLQSIKARCIHFELRSILSAKKRGQPR